jgi:hypothetical protein
MLRSTLLGTLSLAVGVMLCGCSEPARPPAQPRPGIASAHNLSVSDFTPAGQCGDCHVEIHQQWRTSAHSQAAKDPVFWQMLPQAAKDLESRGLGAGFCLKCHSPVATVAKEITAYASVSSPPKLSPVAMEGVTCDFCHTISGNEDFGKDISRGIYLYPRKGDTAIKYGAHADCFSTTNHLTMASKFLKSPELCAICHNFPHPFSGAVLQDTYEEWKNGPYPKLGKRCQDCHMPEYSGSSAIGGPARQGLRAHVFPGGRSDLVKKAATVTTWAQVGDKTDKNRVRLKAIVTNSGSGHFMPTGLPGLRRMWVEIVARSPDGAAVFTDSSPIGVEPLGADGKPTMPWNAVRFGKDTRIPPQKSQAPEWQFSLAQNGPSQVEVRVSVFYQFISKLAAQTAGIKPSPPIEIASDRLRVFKDGRVEKIAAD